MLTAVAGGAALTAAIGAHRSLVVVDETMREHRQPDVMHLVDLPGFDWGPIVRLPYVESYGLFAATGLCLKETGGLGAPETLCGQAPVKGGWYDSIWRIDTLEGRMPTGPREIAINRLAQQKYGWDVGDHLHVVGVAPGRLEDYWAGRPRGRRGGPTFDLTVTAVHAGDDAWRAISGGNGQPGFEMSASFIPTYGDRLEYREQAFLRLHGRESDIPRLRDDVTRITGDPAFPIRNVGEAQRRVERSTRVEAAALALFAAAVVVAALVLLGQALTRLITSQGGDAQTLRSLGMAPATLVAALAAPGAVVGIVGAAGAVLIALGVSPRMPIGVARSFELDRGVKFDLAVLGPGAVGIVLATTLASVATASITIRRLRRLAAPTGSRTVAFVARLPLPPSLGLGVRMALERRPGGASIPVRTALVAAVFGVLAVVAALTVRQGIGDTIAHHERAGRAWDLAYFTEKLHDRAIANDKDIAGGSKVTQALVDLDGLPIPAYAVRPLSRPLDLVVIDGRAPKRADEVTLGPSTASALGVGVGDRVRAGPRKARPVRVVGTALLWEDPGVAAYDEGAWTTEAGLHRLKPAEPHWERYFVDVRPGADVARVRHRLAAAGGMSDDQFFGEPPAAIDNLHTTRRLPALLGELLALLAAGAVAHTLLITVRRRGRDLAVLRVLGLSGGQARAVLAWQATTVALAGLVVGIPAGILAGQLIWRGIATSMPLDYVAPGVPLTVVLVVPAALLLVNAMALWPGRAAARMRPASVLRAE